MCACVCVCVCEFCKAMGNGPGILKEYNEDIEQSRIIQDMFVWEFKDQGGNQVINYVII